MGLRILLRVLICPSTMQSVHSAPRGLIGTELGAAVLCQGDRERALGLPSSAIRDRSRVDVPSSQARPHP